MGSGEKVYLIFVFSNAGEEVRPSFRVPLLSVTIAVRYRRRELCPSVLAELWRAGRVSVLVRLHVDSGSASAFIPRVAAMERLGPSE